MVSAFVSISEVKSVLALDIYFGHPWPTQPSIPSGLVNEYPLWLGMQRQVWFSLLADECGVCR